MATPSSPQMTQIRTDLWQTRTDTPFPGLTTHSYLWTPGGSNAHCSTVRPARRTSRRSIHSAGSTTNICPTRTRPAPCWPGSPSEFGTRLRAPAAERETIEQHSPIDVPLSARHIDDRGVEVIPTPGHSPGSTSYLVEGAQGRYLFTGDTMFVAADGRWSTFVIPGIGDAAAMADSLQLLAGLQPDVVISSAYGARAVTVLDEGAWPACVDEALLSIPVTR